MNRPGCFSARITALLIIAMALSLLPAETLDEREAVILLHGLARGSRSMEAMASALSRSGFRVFNIPYPSRSASIRNLSETVIGRALKDPLLADCSKIHFVTHSLGGILVRSYFSLHRDERLSRVVMLGPPNRGSEVVDRIGSWRIFKALNGPAGEELGTTPSSTPNLLGPVDFDAGIIAGDRSINLINSRMIPGPDDGKVSIDRTKVGGMKDFTIVHAAHPFLMLNRTAIGLTVRFLKTGRFR